MSNMYCMSACSGKECKWENWRNFESESHRNAFPGLFSDWITTSILATARPSSRLIAQYQLISAFSLHGISAIFNLQELKEHSLCGDGVHDESGFSYRPEDFMAAGISFYNFSWTDMDVPDCAYMLSIVQVMAHALESGEKIAVHCHAGLGRTGLAIACYLCYARRLSPEEAINHVRVKRPLAIQNRKQSVFVSEFVKYLDGLRLYILPRREVKSNRRAPTFSENVQNQKSHLHGTELRMLKHVPKVVYELVHRMKLLLRQSRKTAGSFADFDTLIYSPFVRHIIDYDVNSSLNATTSSANQLSGENCLVRAINQGQWDVVWGEKNPILLLDILLLWIISLREPLIPDFLIDSLVSVVDIEKVKHRDLFCTLDCILDLLRMPQYVKLHSEVIPVVIRKLAILCCGRLESLRQDSSQALLQIPLVSMAPKIRSLRGNFFHRLSRSLSNLSLNLDKETPVLVPSFNQASAIPEFAGSSPRSPVSSSPVLILDRATELIRWIFDGRSWADEASVPGKGRKSIAQRRRSTLSKSSPHLAAPPVPAVPGSVPLLAIEIGSSLLISEEDIFRVCSLPKKESELRKVKESVNCTLTPLINTPNPVLTPTKTIIPIIGEANNSSSMTPTPLKTYLGAGARDRLALDRFLTFAESSEELSGVNLTTLPKDKKVSEIKAVERQEEEETLLKQNQPDTELDGAYFVPKRIKSRRVEQELKESPAEDEDQTSRNLNPDQ